MAQNKFDVCVVGSGAGGGTLAAELARAGASVVLIEAGTRRDPAKLHTHSWPYERVKSEVPPVEASSIDEPVEYTGDPVGISRGRVLGGRTTHWNAVSLRFSADDFREWSVNGVEEDWPISYDELAPYYDRAEQLMVVCGTKENLEVLPDGKFIRPLPLRCSEKVLGRAAEKLRMRVIPVRKALATEPGHGRLPCHHCGHCMQGCGVAAIFNTAEHVIPQALETGRLTVAVAGWLANCWPMMKDKFAPPLSLTASRGNRTRSVLTFLQSAGATPNPPACCSIPAHGISPTGWPTVTTLSGDISTGTSLLKSTVI